jgi:hypothetical protein
MGWLVAVASTLGVLGASAWLANLVVLAWYRDRIVFLADLPADPPAEGWPTLAVVFAARDEAGMVEPATRSMLGQDYPGLEVIADATGAILDKIARDQPRLRVVHVTELPRGWLGKTNALQLASEATETAWVLFTDGDVILEPGTLQRAVSYAEARGLDHLAILPGVPSESAGERLFLAFFGLVFSLGSRFPWVADMRSQAHAGIGAFNLVRLSAFRAIGGFRHVALSVDDDMRLGQALKFAGYRPEVLLGRGAVSVRWQVGLGGMIRGLEKNFFAATGFNLLKTGAGASFLAILGIGPFLGLFVGPGWTRIACAVGIVALAATLLASEKQSEIPWYYALAMPFAAITLLIALGRSVVLTLARNGVRWRGHHYPLAELKQHVRVRDAWTREVWKSTR